MYRIFWPIKLIYKNYELLKKLYKIEQYFKYLTTILKTRFAYTDNINRLYRYYKTSLFIHYSICSLHMKKHTLNFFNSRLHSYPRVAFAKLYLSKTAIDLLNDRVVLMYKTYQRILE